MSPQTSYILQTIHLDMVRLSKWAESRKIKAPKATEGVKWYKESSKGKPHYRDKRFECGIKVAVRELQIKVCEDHKGEAGMVWQGRLEGGSESQIQIRGETLRRVLIIFRALMWTHHGPDVPVMDTWTCTSHKPKGVTWREKCDGVTAQTQRLCFYWVDECMRLQVPRSGGNWGFNCVGRKKWPLLKC